MDDGLVVPMGPGGRLVGEIPSSIELETLAKLFSF